MIQMYLSKNDYVYDVQGLCQSFYPWETIQVQVIEVKLAQAEWEQEVENLITNPKQENSTAYVSADGRHLDERLRNVKVWLGESAVSVGLQEGAKQVRYEEMVCGPDRRSYKNAIKKSLYQALSAATGKQLPWGTLTGVRPTKLIMECLEVGMSEQDIYTHMKRQYFCTEEKTKLGYTIAKQEWDLLQAISYQEGYSLYIGIPFCPTRCAYCSFPSYPMEQFGSLMDSYLEALEKEMVYGATMFQNKKLSSIYIGGGTPTTLEPEQLQRLLQMVKKYFPVEEAMEWTVEAGRPDTVNAEKLKILKHMGVTRISINPQTMQEDTLQRIGRQHTVKEIVDIFHLARKLGHDNINMDLILGLPGEDAEAVEDTLNQIAALDPDNLTVHSLVLKRAARLNVDRVNADVMQSYQTGTEQHTVYVMDTEANKMAKITENYAVTHGYLPYYMYRQKTTTGSDGDSRENIGYAKPGKACIYNVLIMEEKQSILALGAGASSKFLLSQGKKKLERVENVKSVTDYIARIEEMIQRKEVFRKQHEEAFGVK